MLDGKICIVTGAAQGIGRCIVELFAKNRTKAIYACDRNADSLADITSRLPSVIPVALDVTDRPAIARLITDIAAEHATIDVLVNNAGSI